jgi:hypothetical protein
MSPSKMYRQLHRTRNIDARGAPAPSGSEYHKPVCAGAHFWNHGDLAVLVKNQPKTGGQS